MIVEPINVKPNQVYYVLKSLIHTILFNRIAGIHVTPCEVHCPLFDQVTYVKIDSNEVDRDVEDALSNICMNYKKGSLQIYVKLYTIVTKYGFLGEYKENIEWERWTIELNLSDPCRDDVMLNRIGSILSLCMKYQDIPFMKNVGFSITPVIEKESSIFDLFRSSPQLIPILK